MRQGRVLEGTFDLDRPLGEQPILTAGHEHIEVAPPVIGAPGSEYDKVATRARSSSEIASTWMLGTLCLANR
jgi:hypothetical protein